MIIIRLFSASHGLPRSCDCFRSTSLHVLSLSPFQVRDTFIAERGMFMKYGSQQIGSIQVQGQGLHVVIKSATDAINRARLTKLEALLCLIMYKGGTKHKLKAVNRVEAEFASTKMDPSTVVLRQIWKDVEQIKKSKT